MPQIYGFSPKGNKRTLLFQYINQNTQQEQIKRNRDNVQRQSKENWNFDSKLESKEKKNRRKELADNSQRGFAGCSPSPAAPVPAALRARTCVLAGVGDERAGHGEGFAAAVTHVGLLARVPPHVVRQRAGLGEALPAAVAHVRLLPAVLPATTHPSHPRARGAAPTAEEPASGELYPQSSSCHCSGAQQRGYS